MIAVLTLAGLVSGCALPPAVRHLPPLKSTEATGGIPVLSTKPGDFPNERWWTSYGDPGLDALVDEGLRNSPDLAMAMARIRAADAAVLGAGGALQPSVTLDGTIGGNKQSYNLGIPAQFVPKGIISTGEISSSIGLNLDLWGKSRAALAAARGEAEAARVDAAQAKLLIASGIAISWGNLSQLTTSRALSARSVDALAGIERLTTERVRAGIDNRADLELAIGRRAAAEQTLAALTEAIALERNRLAALIGAGPERASGMPSPRPDLNSTTEVPSNLSARLLGRRPDIVSARLRAEAAAQRMKSARRAFFPDINLAAVVGLQSFGLSELLKSDSEFARFGPAVSLPLFDGQRLKSNYRLSEADYDQAVARYDQTLLAALHEVGDTLESRRALTGRLEKARTAAKAATEAARMMRMRQTEGIASVLQVLSAEDDAIASQQLVAELEARSFLLDIALVRALGGGFIAYPTERSSQTND